MSFLSAAVSAILGFYSANEALGLFLFLAVEEAGVPLWFLPGDTLVIAAGAQTGRTPGSTMLVLLAAVLGVCVGSSVLYAIARRGGRVLNRHNLERAQRFLDRKGFFAIVAARWIPWIRTLAPLIAGAARMDPRKFLLATATGGLLWVPTLVLLGYYGAGLLDSLPWLKHAALWGSIAFFVLGTAYGVWRYRQEMRRPVDETSEAAPA